MTGDVMAGQWKITRKIAELRENVMSLSSDISALAKAEIEAQKRKAIMGSVWGGLAAVFALLTLVLLPIVLGFVLVAVGLAPWLAFLIVFVVFAILAAGAGLLAKQQFSSIEPPKRTIDAVKNSMAAPKGEYPIESDDEDYVKKGT